ncbi:hypothetical protein ACFL2S_04080 [Thermodesulfobacteriota bacterium]
MDKFDAPLVKRFCSIDESGENEDKIPLTYAEQIFSSDNMEDNLWRYALYIGGSLYRPADKVETYIKRRDAGDRNTCMICGQTVWLLPDYTICGMCLTDIINSLWDFKVEGTESPGMVAYQKDWEQVAVEGHCRRCEETGLVFPTNELCYTCNTDLSQQYLDCLE